jgi:hypothetical protein
MAFSNDGFGEASFTPKTCATQTSAVLSQRGKVAHRANMPPCEVRVKGDAQKCPATRGGRAAMKPRAASTRPAVSDCPSVRYERAPSRAVCTLMLHGRRCKANGSHTYTVADGIPTTSVPLRHEVCREHTLQMQTADVLERPRGQPDMSQVVNAAKAQRTRAPLHLAAKPWTHH